MSCSFCGQTADEALSIRHRACGCMSHVDCLPDPASPSRHCAQHDPNAPVKSDDAWPTIQAHVSAEPRPLDGVDYVLKPGVKQAPSALKTGITPLPPNSYLCIFLFLSSRVVFAFDFIQSRRRRKDVSESRFLVCFCISPLYNIFSEFLLNNGVPIDTIIKRNKLGLQHFLKAGITLDDFLKNGYKWKDLLKFDDIANGGPERALQALTIGLKASANHFRLYPAAFPVKEVRDHTQFENRYHCNVWCAFVSNMLV